MKLRRQIGPGIRVVPVPADGWEHLTIRVGEGGHPCAEDPLVRQALAFGIDRARSHARSESSYQPASTVRPQDSIIFFTASPYYRPNWTGSSPPGRARDSLLEQAGCRRGSDGIFVCARRAALAPPRDDRGTERARADGQARPGAAPAGRDRACGRRLLRLRSSSAQIVPRADSTSRSSPGSQGRSTGPGLGEPAAASETQNYTGYCQRLVTRDLDRAARILDPTPVRSCVLTGPTRRWRRQCRHIPLYPCQRRSGRPSATARFVSTNRADRLPWNAETGGSTD